MNDALRYEKIGEIVCCLAEMNDEQIKNMYIYALDEYKEPNHEAEALNAIVELSRRRKREIAINKKDSE